MAQLPQNLLRTEVSGPAQSRRAEANDFGAGRDTLIGATRSASNATRQTADAARVRAGSIDRAADAELRAGLAEAGGIASIGRAAGDIGDALYERRKSQEISDLTAKLANGQAKWATHLDETLRTADPADTQVVSRFLKDFGEYGKGLEKGLQTRAAREYARQGAARLKGHFFETAMKGQAELARVKTVQDYAAHQSQSTNALMVDPEGLTLALERHDLYLANAKGLDSKRRLELETAGRAELARAAVRGVINRDFMEARERLKTGEFSQYLDADATHTLLKEVDAEERDQRLEESRRLAEARAQREIEQKAKRDEAFDLWVDGKLTPTWLKKSGLDPEDKFRYERMIDESSRRARAEEKTDERERRADEREHAAADRDQRREQQVQLKAAREIRNKTIVSSALRRIDLPDDNPWKIKDEREILDLFGRGAEKDDVNFLIQRLRDSEKPELKYAKGLRDRFNKATHTEIVQPNPLTGLGKDAGGETRFLQFQAFAEQKIKERSLIRYAPRSPARPSRTTA